MGYIVDHKSNGQHHKRPEADGDKRIEIAEGMNLLAADNGYEGCCAAGRVQRFGCMHHGDGCCHCQGRGEPGAGRKALVAGNADDSGKNMTAYKVSRLRQRTFNGPVDQNR